MTFKRENRYLVLRWDDIDEVIDDEQRFHLQNIIQDVKNHRAWNDKEPSPEYVCLKSTYPEYEYVWKCIEDRVTKKEQEQNVN